MQARLKRTTRKATAGYSGNSPNHRNDPAPVTPSPAELDSFPRVIVAKPGQVLPSRRNQLPGFEQVLAHYEQEDAERQAKYAAEDAAEAAEAEQAASALLNLAEPGPEPEPEYEPDAESDSEPEPVTTKPKRKRAFNKQPRQTKPRGTLKSKGGVSYCKPQGNTHDPGYWIATYKNFRKTGLPTKEAAEAKLKQWIDQDLCPCCERVWLN
jgi:hypothetical protein